MKLIVQIPCFNEEKTLLPVLESIPKNIKGVDKVEILIIDDGSSDKTVEVAEKFGVDHIVKHVGNKGLARSFSDGIQKSLELGADIIVNTDGDNQYPQERIPDLIKPIIDGTHDIVIADRQTSTIKHFGFFKKTMQRFGSWIVNLAAGTKLPDAPSGFRAYSKEAAMRLNVVTDFSYAMETIIQAGKKKIAITSIPVKTNPKTRESRLFNNIFEHMSRSGSAILRSYTMFRPFKVFLTTGLAMMLIGSIPFIRFLYLVIAQSEPTSGRIQSLVFGTVFVILGFLFIILGVIADLVSLNRKLIEEILYNQKKDKS